jgi:hypothetical protein
MFANKKFDFIPTTKSFLHSDPNIYRIKSV